MASIPPFTGDYLYRYLQQKVNADYSTFVGGIIKANRLFLDGFLALLDKKFDDVENQKTRDEINYLIKTQQVFSLNNNSIYQAPLQISYISFVGATAQINTYLPHNLTNGDSVTLSGVETGILPQINNTFPATVISQSVFSIPFSLASGIYTSNTGMVTYPKMISDYWQIIQVSARYDVPYNGNAFLSELPLQITGVSNTTPVQITVNRRTDIRDYMRGYIGRGIAVADIGDVYFQELNDFQFALYKDQSLQIPITPVSGWTSGGTIYKTYYNQCKPFLPRTKISPLGQPTADDPRWKDSQRMLVFHPINLVCKEITADYYKQPDVVIDCANTVIDYSNYYSQKFLELLVEETAFQYSKPARDEVLYNQSGASVKMEN